MVVTVWSSVDEFQALDMRLAARVLLPGTGCVAFVELMDLVCLTMDLTGKSFLPRGSLAFFDFHTMRAVCKSKLNAPLKNLVTLQNQDILFQKNHKSLKF